MTSHRRVLAAVPWVFVVLWSTGFPLSRYATRDAGPLTFLCVRLAIAAVILAALATVTGAPRAERQVLGWAALAGIGLHAVYLGGVFVAIDHGLPSGLGALISALHPVLTAVVGTLVLGERLTSRQWIGVGLGVAGVSLVVAERWNATATVTGFALAAMGVAVVGMSAGTLTQRARATAMPLLWGTAVHYGASALVLAGPAVVAEDFRIRFTARTLWSLAWAIGVLSILAVLALLWLLARQAAATVGSLFFLTPALSTVEGAILFSERLGVLSVVGLVVALAGVALTTRATVAPPVRTN